MLWGFLDGVMDLGYQFRWCLRIGAARVSGRKDFRARVCARGYHFAARTRRKSRRVIVYPP